MKTLPFLPHHFAEIKEHLQKGYPVIFPTETCYGFSGDVFSQSAMHFVESIKKRKNNPFLILVKNIEQMQKYARVTNTEIIKKYSEEKSTSFILPKTEKIPDFFFPTFSEIGIRIPKYNPLIGFLSFYKSPIFSTSCNISGFAPLYNSKKIQKIFGDTPNLLFCDAGNIEMNPPSRIIKISNETIEIIRE